MTIIANNQTPMHHKKNSVIVVRHVQFMYLLGSFVYIRYVYYTKLSVDSMY